MAAGATQARVSSWFPGLLDVDRIRVRDGQTVVHHTQAAVSHAELNQQLQELGMAGSTVFLDPIIGSDVLTERAVPFLVSRGRQAPEGLVGRPATAQQLRQHEAFALAQAERADNVVHLRPLQEERLRAELAAITHTAQLRQQEIEERAEANLAREQRRFSTELEKAREGFENDLKRARKRAEDAEDSVTQERAAWQRRVEDMRLQHDSELRRVREDSERAASQKVGAIEDIERRKLGALEVELATALRAVEALTNENATLRAARDELAEQNARAKARVTELTAARTSMAGLNAKIEDARTLGEVLKNTPEELRPLVLQAAGQKTAAPAPPSLLDSAARVMEMLPGVVDMVKSMPSSSTTQAAAAAEPKRRGKAKQLPPASEQTAAPEATDSGVIRERI